MRSLLLIVSDSLFFYLQLQEFLFLFAYSLILLPFLSSHIELFFKLFAFLFKVYNGLVFVDNLIFKTCLHPINLIIVLLLQVLIGLLGVSKLIFTFQQFFLGLSELIL